MRLLPKALLALIAPVALTACNYEPPLHSNGGVPILNGITGSVTAVGPAEAAPTVVLMFSADAPGPPEGTGFPRDFSVVTVAEFQSWRGFEDPPAGDTGTGGSGTMGDDPQVEFDGFTGPFSVVEVEDGAYQFDAIMDVDGDFNPLAFTLAGATCGDWQGSFFEAGSSTVKGDFSVKGAKMFGGADIQVREQLTTERPAFVFPNGQQRISYEQVRNNPLAPPSYPLRPTGVHAQFSEGMKNPDKTNFAAVSLDIADPCITDPADPRLCIASTECQSAFSVYYKDADGDGAMDPHPDYPLDFGLKDIWPRVYLEYLGVPELDEAGEVVVDEHGYPQYTPPDLPEGEAWIGENFTFGLEAVFGLPVVPVGEPIKMAEISVLFAPIVAHSYPEWNDACGDTPPEDLTESCLVLYDITDPEVDLSMLPKGIWAVNLVSWTGQTWGLPNELSEWGVPSTAEGFDPMTQGGFLRTVQ